MLKHKSMIKDVKNFNLEEKKEMMEYIESEIRSYINEGHDSFSVRELFGYENYDWCKLDLPIKILYLRYYEKYHDNDKAIRQAGIALGLLTKRVVDEMKNMCFKITKQYRQNVYVLVK